MWKFIIFFLFFTSLSTLGFVLVKTNNQLNEAGIDTGITLSPFSDLNYTDEEPVESSYPLGNPINILLLGIDRRSRLEYSYRTDIMILLSINPQTNKVTLTSLPRDLWYNGQKLNGLYINYGWEVLQTVVEEITGFKPERFVLTDFKDFSWIVDAMDGVTVNVDRTFTDVYYPVDETKEYQTISFTQGPEKLTGERALLYARSRKGDNGEGSDWARMRRQHKILEGMLAAIMQPESIFNPMVVKEAFKTVTTNRMDTNLQLSDAQYLWDFYKDKDLYTIHSLLLDYEYLYSPPLAEYGGAWTIIPEDGNYQRFQTDLYNKLYGIVVEEIPEEIPVDGTSEVVEIAQDATDL